MRIPGLLLFISLLPLGSFGCNYMLILSSHCKEGLSYDEALDRCVPVSDVGFEDPEVDSEMDSALDIPEVCQPDSTMCSGQYDYLICARPESGPYAWQYGGSCGLDPFGNPNLCYHPTSGRIEAICCSNACEPESSECDGANEYHECLEDQNGCLAWGNTLSCEKDDYNQSPACYDNTEDAVNSHVCCINECKAGKSFCKTDLKGYYARCESDDNDCYKGSQFTSCPNSYSCKPSITSCVTADTLINSLDQVTNISAEIKAINEARFVISWFYGDADPPMMYPNDLINAGAKVSVVREIFQQFMVTGTSLSYYHRMTDRPIKIERLDPDSILSIENRGNFIKGSIQTSDGFHLAAMDYITAYLPNGGVDLFRIVPFEDRFVVIWQESIMSASHWLIRGTARYSHNGHTVAGSDFDLFGHTLTESCSIEAQRLNDTRFVLVWYPYNPFGGLPANGFNGAIFGSDGSRLTDFQITKFTLAGFDPTRQSIFRVDDHRFVVLWTPRDDIEYPVTKVSFFDSNGGKVQSDLSLNFSSNSPLAQLGAGPTFRLLYPFFTGILTPSEINGVIINGEGQSIASQFNIPLNAETVMRDSNQIKVAAIGEQAFIIVWSQFTNGASDYDIFAVMLDSGGRKLSSVFRVNQNTEGNQYYPAVDVWGPNNIIILWEHQQQNNSSNVAIYGQMILFP